MALLVFGVLERVHFYVWNSWKVMKMRLNVSHGVQMDNISQHAVVIRPYGLERQTRMPEILTMIV
jgi:hypothetical protein